MACYHPIPGYLTGTGHVVFSELSRHDIRSRIEVPCGQCVGCRLSRAREWTLRCMHEKLLHSESCFLTLTYDDEHLPPGNSLRYSDVQAFLRRLRRAVRVPIRFVCCGEYGDANGRAHYHLLLFGWTARDIRFAGKGESGLPYYESALLAKCWPQGASFVGELTAESAGYVARYSLKKVTGQAAEAHYGTFTDPDTGVVAPRVPEFLRCSLKPGIGAGWYARNPGDYHSRDYAVLKGARVPVPRYYDKILRRSKPEDLEFLKFGRETKARAHADNNTDERLATREIVHKARIRSLKRSI